MIARTGDEDASDFFLQQRRSTQDLLFLFFKEGKNEIDVSLSLSRNERGG